MADPLLLGIDLGTSSLKCGAIDLAGECAGFARVPYPTHEAEEGSEQHAADWWSALANGVRAATADIDRKRIAALGIGGHGPSPVFVDAHLQPVAPILPWFDGRSSELREQLLQMLGRQPANGAERFLAQLAARAMWLRTTSPQAFARAVCVMHSSDYLVARLTGQRVLTSPRRSDVFAAAGLTFELLPEKECRAGVAVGRLRSDVAGELQLDPATVVVTCGLDSFQASVGSGMRVIGDACINTGSSSIVSLLGRPGCVGRFEWAGCPLFSRPVQPGGRCLNCLPQTSGSYHSLTDLLQAASRLRPPLQIHRRAARLLAQLHRDDREVRGSMKDLLQQNSTTEVARWLLDNIFLRQRMVLAELEDQGGPAGPIRSVGRLAAHAEINQLQADVLGRSVQIPRMTESGALGAAMLAATAVGLHEPIEAAARMVRIQRTCEPCCPVSAEYGDLMAEFLSNRPNVITADRVESRIEHGSAPI